MGAIYPDTNADGTVSFLLDATMTTPDGLNYFGFGLKVRTSRPAVLRIVWRQTGGPDVTVLHLGSSCFASDFNTDLSHGVMMNLGKREGMRLTGRETVGAAPGQVTNLTNQGTPVFMYECANDANGPPFERRIHVLLPERRIQFRGSLLITAAYFEQPPPPQPRPIFDTFRPLDLGCLVRDCNTPPTLSPPLVLPLVRERPKLLVVGDSVAWGQGVRPNSKASRLVVEDMRNRYERVRLSNKAHSGATIRVGNAVRIRDVDIDDCTTDRSRNGEIPRASPSVQCQILDAVSSECFASESDIGVAPIPAMRCFETLDERRPDTGESRFTFDLGPTYDVVIMWGCINDVNAPSIFTGLLGDFLSEALIERTTEKCNLRNGLSDIREFLPNARSL